MGGKWGDRSRKWAETHRTAYTRPSRLAPLRANRLVGRACDHPQIAFLRILPPVSTKTSWKPESTSARSS